MTAQGWQPGDYLGAVNAEHAGHYTAANASHIRILLREDNLGLGAQVGKTNAETFGLSLFSGVLGRLNGKSDAELQKYQSALKDAELRTYHAQKYGLMNFVRGGWLVGDQIEPTLQPLAPTQTESDITPNQDRKAKKRKIENRAETGDNKEAKKTKVRSRTKHDSTLIEQSGEQSSEQGDLKIKKKRKVRTEEQSSIYITDENSVAEPKSLNSATTTDTEDKETLIAKSGKKREKKSHHEGVNLESAQDERTRAKPEKRARKEERRKRKEERRQLKAEKRIEGEAEIDSSTTESKPTTGTSTPVFGGNRHAVRQRYIQQKRMASMDAKAMKEIFMLSAAG